MADHEPDVVQPDEGQGDSGGQGAAPYQEYLDRIPEEMRGEIEPVFKEWDANTTRRFQESAERQKQWEPYEELGITQLPVEEAQWLLQFRDAALNNPQAVQQWWDEYAQQNGLTPQQAAEQQQPGQGVEDFFATDDQAVAKLLDERLGPLQQQVEQFNQWREQQDYTARVAEAERYVEGQIEELQAKHPNEFDRELVEKLVGQYVESDPEHAVQRAFDDSRALIAQIEKRTLQGKANQPAPAESGGVAVSAPEDVKSLEEAGRIAIERLRADRAA